LLAKTSKMLRYFFKIEKVKLIRFWVSRNTSLRLVFANVLDYLFTKLKLLNKYDDNFLNYQMCSVKSW
jgi:hypothetical protein